MCSGLWSMSFFVYVCGNFRTMRNFTHRPAGPAMLAASAAFALALPLSCSNLDGDGHRRSSYARGERYAHDTSISGPSSDEKKDTSIYAIGVEYPSGYDWRLDPDYGNAECRLVVFNGQKRMIVADAGPDRKISPDADRNRVIGGHLYSDYSDGSSTWVHRDGELLFRYDIPETILGFVVSGGDVHTLGENRSGEGLSLRRNGQEVFSSSTGHVLGNSFSEPLYEDEGELCFAYCTGTGDARKYYQFSGSTDEKVDIPDHMLSLLAMRRVGGNLYMAGATVSSRGCPVFFYDGKTMPASSAVTTKSSHNCRFIVSGGSVYLSGDLVFNDNSMAHCLWRSNGETVISATNVYEYYLSDGVAAYPETDSKGFVQTIFAGGERYTVGDSLKIMSPLCASYSGGKFYAVMTPSAKERSPVLWKNGRLLAYTLNGYMAGVYVDIH